MIQSCDAIYIYILSLIDNRGFREIDNVSIVIHYVKQTDTASGGTAVLPPFVYVYHLLTVWTPWTFVKFGHDLSQTQ